MPWFEISAIALLAAVGWFWFDTLKAREAALAAARETCAAEGLMLLDDTVAVSTLKPARDEDGRIRLQRAYDFEYKEVYPDVDFAFERI